MPLLPRKRSLAARCCTVKIKWFELTGCWRRDRNVRIPLLANMTEFGRTPMLTASEFEELGYRMVIWPVSSLRVANKAQEKLYAALRQDGSTKAMLEQMQTHAELYDLIGLGDYEALDQSIVRSIPPKPIDEDGEL